MFFKTDEEAKEHCKKYENAERLARTLLHSYADNSGKGWTCTCGSGTGKHGTGISLTNLGGVGWFKCFACDWGGDIIALYQHEKGCDYATTKREIFKEMNIRTEEQTHNHNQNYNQNQTDEKKEQANKRFLQELASADYDLENNTDVTAYLAKRNISIETAKRFNLRQIFKAFKGMQEAEDLIIIPTSDSSFLYRSISSDVKRKSAGKSHIFNAAACTKKQGVFVCEGAFDALSFEECNFNAIAMNGVGKTDFIRLAKLNKDKIFFICTDKDDAGKKVYKELIEELRELDIKAFSALDIIAKGSKDINETLCCVGRDAFIQRVNEYLQDPAMSEREEYENSGSFETAGAWFNTINKKKTAIPTGFQYLDSKLDGGLHTGLYSFGAGTAMGKTAFILQCADNIAKAGTDVLYFSLEMSKEELFARSLSRETYELLKKQKKGDEAKTTRDILIKRINNETDMQTVTQSLHNYCQYAKRIHVFEGVGDIGTSDIRKAIKKHLLITNRKCVVIVDYVQILASVDIHLTDKQAIDKNIVELKRISRDYQIPVIAISSFNRESYNQVVNLSSFKESGAVEYTSDVVFAMQYDNWDYEDKESEPTRQKRIRELKERNTEKKLAGEPVIMHLKLLKNRNGVTDDKNIKLMFKSRYNYFYEKIYI